MDLRLTKVAPADRLIKTTPTKAHYDRVIEPPCRIFIDDVQRGAYVRADSENLRTARKLAREVRLTNWDRTEGLWTKTAIFGPLARIKIRHDYCRYTASTVDNPAQWALVKRLAEYVAGIYRDVLPGMLANDLEVIAHKVHADWRLIGDTPFTTCQFNVNHAVKYHRDTGNFKDTYSNVLILREGIEGGELVLPEYRVALSQCDGALLIFAGQSVIHGVMPVRRIKADGFRCSTVFYAMEGMAHCYPFAEEWKRAKQSRTKTESVFRADRSKIAAFRRSGKA